MLPDGEKWPNFGWWGAFSAFLGHFRPLHANNWCKKMSPGGEKWPNCGWQGAFSASLGHFRPFHANIYLDFWKRYRSVEVSEPVSQRIWIPRSKSASGYGPPLADLDPPEKQAFYWVKLAKLFLELLKRQNKNIEAVFFFSNKREPYNTSLYR